MSLAGLERSSGGTSNLGIRGSTPLPSRVFRHAACDSCPPAQEPRLGAQASELSIVDGSAYCWGSNWKHQLGVWDHADAALPIPVTELGSGVTAISSGAVHTCAIVGGRPWCWGSDSAGQQGNGESATDNAVPALVLELAGEATAITAGLLHTCAIVDGAAWCWGDNSVGQLGNGGFSSQVPVPVTGVEARSTEITLGSRQLRDFAQLRA